MPAIRRIVVFPNHMTKFMKATSVLTAVTFDMNLNGSLMTPSCTSTEFTGPVSANNVKNSMDMALAMIRFGR